LTGASSLFEPNVNSFPTYFLSEWRSIEMGNYLFRVVYRISERQDGVALMYAADEADARVIHATHRSNEILSVTAMTGGFTPGTYRGGGRAGRLYLPYQDGAGDVKMRG
jgi:hypothetical protein